METFEIHIDNIKYTITFNEDETYLIIPDDEDKIPFVIMSTIEQHSVVWKLSLGEAPQALINELGARIEKHYM
jgi:hypothetical protein